MGVNKYILDKEDDIEVLSIDNSKVLQVQVRVYQEQNVVACTYVCVYMHTHVYIVYKCVLVCNQMKLCMLVLSIGIMLILISNILPIPQTRNQNSTLSMLLETMYLSRQLSMLSPNVLKLAKEIF